MKKVLFLVTGMTPQIITETIWALAFADDTCSWIPDEVHVLSTQDGLDQIKARLFQEGIFVRFTKDYPELQSIKFAENHLHSIANEKETLSDLKTPKHNEIAADLICAKIHDFTLDDNIELHVSIAGGRKTMGFYAGYALSLYGRAQDSISHVLVEEKFEHARDFFYPTLTDYYVTDRNGKEHNSKNAQVWLAKIPFVRMRDAIIDKHQLAKHEDFSEVVAKINESFKDVTLTINVHDKTIDVNNGFKVIELPPREFALLWWFADLRKQGKTGIIAPKVDAKSKNVALTEADHVAQLTCEFEKYYTELKNSEELVVDKKFFNTVKSLLNTALIDTLGLELAAKIGITQGSKGKPFYLDLAPETIKIVDNFDKK